MRSKRIGLALSGGGYRAAAYHLGTLKALDRLGILSSVDVLSTISGGSITGAAYCLHKGNFESFYETQKALLARSNIISFVLTSPRFLLTAIPLVACFLSGLFLPFTKLAPLAPFAMILPVVILVKFQFKILPISKLIEKAYCKHFFGDAKLSDLCNRPELAIGSTNLQTCRHFTFSKRKMEDSVYAYQKEPILFDGKNFPISRAVMASSSVPFAFTPISIDKEYYQKPEQSALVTPMLVDGGVYDNQGIHKITQINSSYACDYVIVSDAGNKMPFSKAYNNTFTLLLRTVETFMARIKNFQMMTSLYNPHRLQNVAYQSLGWNLENCIPGFIDAMKNRHLTTEVCEAHDFPQGWLDNPQLHDKEINDLLTNKCKYEDLLSRMPSVDELIKARHVGTNLWPLSKTQIDCLIKIADVLTEMQVRLYLPMIVSR